MSTANDTAKVRITARIEVDGLVRLYTAEGGNFEECLEALRKLNPSAFARRTARAIPIVGSAS